MPKNIYDRNGVYWARFKIAGRTYRKSLHVRVEPARRAEPKAIKALHRLRLQIEDEVRHGIMPPIIWQQAVIEWHKSIQNQIAPNTFRRYLTSIAQCRPWLDGKPLDEINSRAFLNSLAKARGTQGVTNATVRRDLTAISSVLALAEHEGWTDINAAQQVNRRRIPERRDPIVLPNVFSINTMLEALPPQIADVTAFAIETGMRQNEIVQLDWHCLDLRRGVATIHKTKGSKVRAVPLNAAAIAILNRQPRNPLGSAVFARTDGSPREWISSQFGATARKVSQKSKAFVRFRFHDLRHLFAVRYLQDEGSIYALQGILGHSSVKTTEMYLAYLTPVQQQDARLGASQKVTQLQRFHPHEEEVDE